MFYVLFNTFNQFRIPSHRKNTPINKGVHLNVDFIEDVIKTLTNELDMFPPILFFANDVS